MIRCFVSEFCGPILLIVETMIDIYPGHLACFGKSCPCKSTCTEIREVESQKSVLVHVIFSFLFPFLLHFRIRYLLFLELDAVTSLRQSQVQKIAPMELERTLIL